jgi:fluoroquinolone transport system permease protein
MNRLLALIKGDLKLQVKYGFYTVYAVVTGLYLLLLSQLSAADRQLIVPFIIYSDPALLGFYFIGGLILLEKGENTLTCLISTPVTIRDYLISKQVSLTFLALLATSVIVFFLYGIQLSYLLLVIGFSLTSCFFVLVGFIAVAKFNTLNEYVLSAGIYMLVLNLPLLDFFGLVNSKLFYLFPTQASLILIRSFFETTAVWKLGYSSIYLLVWIAIAYKFAYQSFYKFIIIRGGDGQ